MDDRSISGQIVAAFVGRKQELIKLNDLAQKRQASLVVIKGRRRIGQSRLAAEFAKDKIFLSFTGLTRESGMTDQSQRDAFAVRLAQQFKLPHMTFTDWSDAFNNLSFHLIVCLCCLLCKDLILWVVYWHY